MKTMLTFGLMLAAAGTLFACGEDGEGDRGQGGTGNQTGGGGTNATNGGSGGTPSGGGGNTSGGSGGGGPIVNTGAALVIGDDLTVVDSAGQSGIDGAAQFVKSPMNPTVTLTATDGKLCFTGETALVPGMDYTNYWGAGVYVDLVRGPIEGAVVVDAGADAGDAGPAIATEAKPWDPAVQNPPVLGFSFVLEGQDPALPDNGVPSEMRLQTRPDGAPVDSSACANLPAVGKHNAVQNITFDRMFFECYNNPPGPAVFMDPLRPMHTKQLENIGFQVNAAIMVAYQFNFCVKDIKPILGE